MKRGSTESVYEYMKQWYDSEYPTDFAVAYDKGYDDLCIYYLCSAGAISPICPDSKAMLKRYKKFTQKYIHGLMGECFKHCAVMVGKHNETIFVPVDDPELDYFVSVSEWEKCGFKFERMFSDKKGNVC